LNGLLKEAASSIVTHCAELKAGMNVLIIYGRHNGAFAEDLALECYRAHAFPYLWFFDESLVKRAQAVSEDAGSEVPKHVRALLKDSDLVIWLTQFENPKSAWVELGPSACSYWDQVDDILKGRPLLAVNMLSAKCLEAMDIDYDKFLVAFANGVNVDYDRVKRTGSAVLEGLRKKELVKITSPDGTDLTFSIKGRRVGIETGTLEQCFSTGKECEVEIPPGEVYVAPIESSARGMLVTGEVRDFGVRDLRMEFHDGRIVGFEAEEGRSSFERLLEEARGDKDRIAEFGIGINHGVKPIGLRIFDEKSLGTAHVAIGNNTHLGGINKASIHVDFIVNRPTIRAGKAVIVEDGNLL
jgi:leucyl aminopeptidase (aminopeptidase T)